MEAARSFETLASVLPEDGKNMLLCWCPLEKLNTNEANSSKPVVTVTTARRHVSEDINVQAKDSWWSQTGTVVRRMMIEWVKTGDRVKDKRKGKEIQQRRFWRHYMHYIFFLKPYRQKDIYGRNVQEKFRNENEVCKYLNSLNLMFFWPCIMNWLYINYQLDALTIIYS